VAKLRVGLTGGIGSGKSEIANYFAERGATIIDADIIAREVVAAGTPGLQEIADVWPEAVDLDGNLDRTALSRIVFADPDAREQLNAITHPMIRARADELDKDAGDGIVVHVVPLLFEGEYWRTCARTVLVIAPEDTRIARVIRRDNTDRLAIKRRIKAQISPEDARQRADYVIENDGDLETLRERANRAYDQLLRDLFTLDGLPHVLVRPMQRDDLEPVDAVVRAAYSLNETQEERIFDLLEQRRGKSLVAEIDGAVAGCVFGNDYGGSAYLSLMAVDPRHQHRGVAASMMRAMMGWAARRNFRDVRLDATEAGARLYERFGFVDVDQTHVYSRNPGPGAVAEPRVRRTSRGDLITIFALDAEAQAADRASMLEPLLRKNESFLDAGGAGYAVLQRRGDYVILGPWVARNPDAADALMHAVVNETQRRVVAYPIASNTEACEILESLGFVKQRTLRHMVHGDAIPISPLLYGRANLSQG
jgi:dephospho-CoA kinase